MTETRTPPLHRMANESPVRAELVSVGRPERVRMPQLVADSLRQQILSGELADGSRLPKEEVLRAHFGVGRPVMREAMRILESEGLLTVLRGNTGGATVQAPRPAHTANALAMLLSSRNVGTVDVGRALHEVEPICARLCAERAHRDRAALVEQLEAVHRLSATAAEEGNVERATSSLRQFHETIVSGCGNTTLAILVGALESIWSLNVHSTIGSGTFRRSRGELRLSVLDHEGILVAIRSGDGAAAGRAVAAHIARVQSTQSKANRDRPVEAALARLS